MFKHYFEQIDGIEIFPMIALFVFISFFLGLIIWVLKANKKYIKEMSELPLEDDEDRLLNGNKGNL